MGIHPIRQKMLEGRIDATRNSRVRGAGKGVTLFLNFIGAIRFRRDIQGRPLRSLLAGYPDTEGLRTSQAWPEQTGRAGAGSATGDRLSQ